MIDIKKKEECNGCYGCFSICPKKCISMQRDNEGFEYPKVDQSKCIDCGLCENVCPVINTPKIEKSKTMAYACKNRNLEERKESSSGGIFYSLCKQVINNGGVVFGAAFDENFNVYHTYAETLDDCVKFRGSKYVQSKIGDSYIKVRGFLEDGKVVLFSGTQCQIKGLNLYLRKKYDNLITVDIVCHGVPSPKIFKSYREKLISLNNSKISDIKFRDKERGWKKYSFVTKFENGSIYSKISREDIYMKGFLNNLYLRPSCYECKAKNFKSGSDISLADYWGIESKHSNFDDDIGVSLVLVNSKKGKNIIDSLENTIEILKTDLEYAINQNPCIIKSVNYNYKREEFFKRFNGDNFDKLVIKYTRVPLINKLNNRVYRILNKIKK